MSARFGASGPLRGTLAPPPDKSISHRAAIVAAMGDGETSVRGYLDAADTRSTLAAVRALGACFAEGGTVVTGAGELRHKESDRIATVVGGLRGLGAEIEATGDGFAVVGGDGLRGGELDAGGDHRLAMLGAVAGLASDEGVEVAGFDAAGVSYPGFGSDLAALLG